MSSPIEQLSGIFADYNALITKAKGQHKEIDIRIMQTSLVEIRGGQRQRGIPSEIQSQINKINETREDEFENPDDQALLRDLKFRIEELVRELFPQDRKRGREAESSQEPPLKIHVPPRVQSENVGKRRREVEGVESIKKQKPFDIIFAKYCEEAPKDDAQVRAILRDINDGGRKKAFLLIPSDEHFTIYVLENGEIKSKLLSLDDSGQCTLHSDLRQESAAEKFNSFDDMKKSLGAFGLDARRSIENEKTIMAKYDVNFEPDKTALEIACSHLNKNLIKELLDNGSELDIPVIKKCWAVFYMAMTEALLLHLYAKQADIQECKKDLIKYAIDNDISLNSVIFEGEDATTLFSEVLEFQDDKFIEDMMIKSIEKYPELLLQGKGGDTPLHWAIYQGKTELAKLLIDKGAGLLLQNKDGSTPLHLAINKNNIELVKLLIEKDAGLSLQNKGGDTPLHLAINKGNTEIAELLIEKDAGLSLQNKDGNTPLNLASIRGNIELVRLLIAKDTGLSLQNNGGDTPLHTVIYGFNTEIAKLLIEKDAELSLQNKGGDTPLHLAINKGNTEIAKVLIEKGVGLDLQDNEGKTSLYLAVERGYIEIANLIIDKDAGLSVQDKTGTTPLHWAINKGNTEIAKLLIEKDAGLALQNNIGRTPLHLAIFKDNIEVVKLLIEKNAGLDLQDNDDGKTPLHWAIFTGKKEIAKLLIEKGVGLDLQDINRNTSLHLAMSLGKTEIAKLIIEKNTGLSLQDNEGKTPLHRAISTDKTEIAKLIIEKDTGLSLQDNKGKTPLHLAIERGYIEIAKLLIEKDAGLSVQDKTGTTPLHWAISTGRKEIAKLLIEKGVGLDLQDKYRMTPLHLAIDKGNIELARLFIDKDAGLSLQNDNGRPPLHFAISIGKTEMAKLFIEKGVGLDLYDKSTNTPLHFAISIGETEIAKLLIEKKVELNVKNRDGNTALHLAIDRGRTDLAKLLIENEAELDVRNNFGDTPLHLAIHKHNMESFRDLVNNIELRGEDGVRILSIPNNDNYTPLHVASANGLLEVVEFLIKNKVDVNCQNKNGTPLILALKNGQMECAQFLIKNGADLNLADGAGKTALHLASSLHNEDLIIQLISLGADLYLADAYGNSLIFDIANGPKIPPLLEKIDVLLKSRSSEGHPSKGIEYDKIPANSHGDTLLHVACRHGNTKLIKLLLENGLKLTDKNSYAETPFTLLLHKINVINKDERLILIDTIFANYLNNSMEILNDFLGNENESFETFIISRLDRIMRIMKEGINPLEFALSLNNTKISRAIVKELGKERFDVYFAKFPDDLKKSFKESLLYDIDNAHLAHKIEAIPDKPTEAEYQMDALFGMFDELSGYDPANPEKENPLESKFRRYLVGSDKGAPLQQLRERMQSFINNCKNRDRRTGIPEGQEVPFWKSVERAMTNTIKTLKNLKGTDDEIYEKKVQVLREYLDLMSYCATRLDVELDKIYYENSGIVRTFFDEIYFQLSERRRITLEGILPRGPQSVHTIQKMLEILGVEYNIPIKRSVDLYPEPLTILDPGTSFRNKYLDGLIDDVKNYLTSNKEMQDQFFMFLEENGREVEKPALSPQEISDCAEYIKNHEGVLPNDATPLAKDMLKYLQAVYGNDYEDYREELQNIQSDEMIATLLIDPVFLTQSDFEKIIDKGDVAFSELDPRLQVAIKSLRLKEGELSEIFRTGVKSYSLTEKQQEKKRIVLDRYMEINFPNMVRKVKDEDVVFLLQKLGVLQVAPNAPVEVLL